jgi:uncharacterized damage-inducible protein DinB
VSPNFSTADRVLIASVIEVLNQGEVLLSELDDESYVRKLPAAFNACIGGHYRHCLDHFRSLLDGANERSLNYDHRERGTLVETDRFAALNATRALREGYERMPAAWLEQQLEVTSRTSYAAIGSQTSGSTVGREIMYVVAHAVHHYALIGIMGRLMGLKMPAGFGVAPSTAKYQADVAADVRRRNPAPRPNAFSNARLLTSAATRS